MISRIAALVRTGFPTSVTVVPSFYSVREVAQTIDTDLAKRGWVCNGLHA